jgi:putative methyltransferase (TIGR04325 family)
MKGCVMKYVRKFIKDCTPPIVLRSIQRLRPLPFYFQGDYANWEEASADCSGYKAENILQKILDATLKVKGGKAAFERDSVLFDEIEYDWPVISGLMWVAARNHGKLNVLDFGGALGSSYFQSRKFLEDLPEVRWNVIEQLHYVQAGQEKIQDDRLRFYPTIDACLAEGSPSVALLSSVLEYLPDPILILNKIFDAGVDVLIINRTLFSLNGSEKIVIQNVSSEIFDASIPCRMLSEELIVNICKRNKMNLMASFPSIGDKTQNYQYRGLIFIRSAYEMPSM